MHACIAWRLQREPEYREAEKMRTTWASFILIGYGLFIGLMLSPTAAAAVDTANMLQEFIPQFAATLAGVLAGAWIAVKIEQQTGTKAEYERRAAAVNLAVHTLTRMYSEQRDFLNQVVQPVRDKVPVWYHMKPSDLRVLPPPQFDYVALQFLFASQDPNIVGALAVEESRFANVVELVRRRTEMHTRELYPKMEAVGAKNVSLAELEQIVGPRIMHAMDDYTKGIVAFCDRGVISTQEVADALYRAAKPLVAGQSIIRFDPREERPTPAAT